MIYKKLYHDIILIEYSSNEISYVLKKDQKPLNLHYRHYQTTKSTIVVLLSFFG